MFDHSNNTGVIDVKMAGSVLEEKSSFKMLELFLSPKVFFVALDLEHLNDKCCLCVLTIAIQVTINSLESLTRTRLFLQ